MNRNKLFLLILAPITTFTALLAGLSAPGRKASAQGAKESRTRAVVDATGDFLKSLGDDQRKKRPCVATWRARSPVRFI